MTSNKDEKKDKNEFSKQSKEYLEKQKEQFQDNINNFSDLTEKTANSLDHFAKEQNKILQKNIDTFSRYNEQNSKTLQEVTNNYVDFQKNILDIYQSSYYQFIDIFSKSLGSLMIPVRYYETYNRINKSITEGTTNTLRIVNDTIARNIETFNKSLDLSQKYYNENAQNYFAVERQKDR